MELGEIVPAGPLAAVNKPGQALGGGEDAEATAGLEVRVRWGKQPQAGD